MTKSITIDNRPVKRVMIGDGLYWEDKPKRFAYYFNGVDHYCRIPEALIVGVDIDTYLLDYEATKQTNKDKRVINSIGINFDSTFLIFTKPSNGSYPSISLSNAVLGRHTMEVWYDGVYYAKFDGVERKTSYSYPSEYTLLGANFGSILSGGNKFTGYIYNLYINGERVNLEDLPGITFTNVTRYELDDNDNIIPSTAKVINTDDN